MKYSGWPTPGELVVGKIEEIEDFGVFVDLQEYEDKQGLIHISEVASGWIKNVRDHVREGQTVVCKVLDVDRSSQQIDLTLKDVNEHQHKETIQRWKNEQKADNWMSLAFGENVDEETYGVVTSELIDAHDSLYEGFEQAAILGPEALSGTDLSEEQIDAIVDTARENVSVPYVTVTGYVDLVCSTDEGVDAVKEALQAAEGNGEVSDEIDLEVTYVGAPEYRIRVQAPNYKTAETELERSAERASEAIAEFGGSGSFHRERKTDDE
jgi:translation initiation factor 2 subunit 1